MTVTYSQLCLQDCWPLSGSCNNTVDYQIKQMHQSSKWMQQQMMDFSQTIKNPLKCDAETKDSPAMRRQTMHMEKATSMMMGSWQKEKQRMRGRSCRGATVGAGVGVRSTDCEELPVLLHTQRSRSICLIHSKVAQKQVNGVLKNHI